VNWQWEYASEDGEDYEWEYSEEEGEDASKEKEKQKKVEEEEDEELEDLDLPDPFGTDPVPQKKDVRHSVLSPSSAPGLEDVARGVFFVQGYCAFYVCVCMCV
jgi:hypothetical protein